MSDKLRVFLVGQKSFGAAVLDLLSARENVQILGVSCPLLNSNGTDDRLFFKARQQELLIVPSGMLHADSLPNDVDLIICAHAHDFIGRKIRLKARLGAIGYHPSLLPLHRGRDAIAWTIRFGDKVAGGSVYWLNETVDGGDIAAQDWCFVQPDDLPNSLWRRELFPMGVRLIGQVLDDLLQGVLIAIPQDPTLATWEPSLGRPPLPRPDLPLLGTSLAEYRVVRERAAN